MNSINIVAIALIIAGALGLAYGSFSYTKQTEQAVIGPLSISVSEKETINVPVWAGGGAIALGIVLLLVGRRKA